MQIEKYLDLRLGEVWKDMAMELESENVRPTSPDLESINNNINACHTLSVALQKSQHLLVDQIIQVCLSFLFKNVIMLILKCSKS